MKNDASPRNLKIYYDRSFYFVYVAWGSVQKARKVIKEQFADLPKKSKDDLIEMVRPHYVADYAKLVEQDLNRIANNIAASVRDENGARCIFSIESEGRNVLVNVDKSEDIQDLRSVIRILLMAVIVANVQLGKYLSAAKKLLDNNPCNLTYLYRKVEKQIMQYSEFGLQVRAIMLKKGIKSKDIAKEIGINQSYLCEILKGTRKGVAQKPKIAEMLGMNINSLNKEVI